MYLFHMDTVNLVPLVRQTAVVLRIWIRRKFPIGIGTGEDMQKLLCKADKGFVTGGLNLITNSQCIIRMDVPYLFLFEGRKPARSQWRTTVPE